jgi:inorganic pyrophosphatase
LVIADQSIDTGILVPTRIIGAMEMIDGGETDTKLIGVIDCDPRYSHIKTMKDLNNHILLEIKDFFQTYKNLQNKKVEVKEFKDLD